MNQESNPYDADKILDRIKTVEGIASDSKLSVTVFDSPRGRVSYFRKTQTIPMKPVLAWAAAKGVNLNWVFLGVERPLDYPQALGDMVKDIFEQFKDQEGMTGEMFKQIFISNMRSMDEGKIEENG